jgi:hypothetical protein
MVTFLRRLLQLPLSLELRLLQGRLGLQAHQSRLGRRMRPDLTSRAAGEI